MNQRQQYETTGFGLFFFALAVLVMQLGTFLCDSAEHPIIAALVLWLPIPLAAAALPWTARRGIFTREGLTIRWGGLFSTFYPWDDLIWATNVKELNQEGSFEAYIRHKKVSHFLHPLYSFYLMMEGVEKGFLLRAASGRAPDHGILPCEESDVLSVTILSPEERKHNEKRRRIGYYLICFSMTFCLTPAWYLLERSEGWRAVLNFSVSLILMVGLMMKGLIVYMSADEMLICDAIYHFKKEETSITT